MLSNRFTEAEGRVAVATIDDAIAAGGGLRIDDTAAEVILRELRCAFLMGRIVGTAEGFVLSAEPPLCA